MVERRGDRWEGGQLVDGVLDAAQIIGAAHGLDAGHRVGRQWRSHGLSVPSVTYALRVGAGVLVYRLVLMPDGMSGSVVVR
ncbi:hypothetical protein DKT69_25310 [Micromonospora sicca]|uniref:Uncharacterized protein n=1 Tax=Micromonospora sicca TaxID=2202420 RepID=A0A317DE19_9ACTN|nr:hypothetical protein DKT69_25310 [Micromonospora sp. 4G51]